LLEQFDRRVLFFGDDGEAFPFFDGPVEAVIDFGIHVLNLLFETIQSVEFDFAALLPLTGFFEGEALFLSNRESLVDFEVQFLLLSVIEALFVGRFRGGTVLQDHVRIRWPLLVGQLDLVLLQGIDSGFL
jgi:hypothetical protein